MEEIAANTFLNGLGSNVATLALVGGGYLLYKCFFKSKCHYSSEKGLELDFGNDSDDEGTGDEEDKTIKNILGLLHKRKSEKFNIPKIKKPEEI